MFPAAAAATAIVLLLPAAGAAQEEDHDHEAEAAEEAEEHAHFDEQIVVLGSRAHARSVTESQVPIDAIPVEDITRQGATTLDYQLRNLIPSFNVATHPISDAATLVRPASLRNLATTTRSSWSTASAATGPGRGLHLRLRGHDPDRGGHDGFRRRYRW